jgi:hypothetical protein
MFQSLQMASKSIMRIQAVYDDCIFFRRYSHLIPTVDQPVKILSYAEVCELFIRRDGRSTRISLSGKKFQWEYDEKGKTKLSLEYEQDVGSISSLMCQELFHAIYDLCTAIFWSVVYSPLFLFGSIFRLYGYMQASSFLERPLTLKKIDPSEYPEIAKIARCWQNTVFLHTRNETFYSCYTICKLIAECLENQKVCSWLYDDMFICVDAQNTTQGMMLTKNNGAIFRKKTKNQYLKIAHLVTNPHNIRSPINAYNFSRVRGAATFLIKEVAKQALSTQKGVYAEIIASSKPFYEKLGFEEIPIDRVHMVDGDIPMVLSGSRLKAFLAS